MARRKNSAFRGPSERSPMLRWSVRNPILLGLLGLTFTLVGVILVTPGFFSHSTALTEQDIGTPAPRDYRATRDFSYTEVDPNATERKREEAARAVPPVYNFYKDVREDLIRRVRASFRSMRQLFEEHAERLAEIERAEAAARPARADDAAARPGEESKELDGPGTTSDARPRPRARPRARRRARAPAHKPDAAAEEEAAAEAERQRVALARRQALSTWLDEQLESRRDGFFRLLQQTLTLEEYHFLADQHFSKQVEDDLVYLLSEVMRHRILDNLRRLRRQPKLGITLRSLRGVNVVSEEHIQEDFGSFLSVQEATERLVLIARQGLKGLDPNVRDRLVDIAGRLVVANCEERREETERRKEAARAAVESLSTVIQFRKGQSIVDRGHMITRQHFAIVRTDLRERRGQDLVLAAIGNGLLLLVLVYTVVHFFRRFVRKFAPERKDFVFLGVWMLTALVGVRLSVTVFSAVAASWRVIPAEAYLFLIPVAAVPMLVRMVMNSETAVATSLVLAALFGIMVDWNLAIVLFVMVSGLTAAGGVGKAKQRTDLLQAALRTGGANAIFVLGLTAVSGSLLSTDGILQILLGLAGGVLSGLVVTAVLPLVEAVFGYTTNIKLLELANLNNPLLKELAIRSPGTFHHSIMVGNLVESAAESIRANPLLARVGAYYHDVGKLKAPHYFAENQRPGQNPHDRLKPSMSALVLKEHVRDGVKLLKSKGYPTIIADICEQHAGTTLISFFYHRAKTMAEEEANPPPLETDYRYSGPKPQTREAALVFLGDAVEAAAKSLPEPSPARLQGLVQNLINARFIDGQLSECDLSLGDLHRIARAFIRSLTGIYHFRPEYPGGDTKQRKKEDTGSNRRSGQTPVEGARRPTTTGDSANSTGERPARPSPAAAAATKDERPGATPSNGAKSNGDVASSRTGYDTVSSMVLAKGLDAQAQLPQAAQEPGEDVSAAPPEVDEAGAGPSTKRSTSDDSTPGRGSAGRGGSRGADILPEDPPPSLRRLGSLELD